MTPSEPETGALSRRAIPVRWILVATAVLLVVMVAIAAAVLVVGRADGDERGATAAAGESAAVTSPYDLTELPARTDLDTVEEAAFVSILVPNEGGTLTSYGVSAELPSARALIEAVRKADQVDPNSAAAMLGGETVSSSLTFVLPTRETLTFALYVDMGIIVRGADVWRPDGDLALLIKAAVAGPR